MLVDVEAAAIQIEHITATIRTRRIGRRIEYAPSTTSTNDEAWHHLEADDADGLVVFSEFQTAGRGRFGRVWESPRGAGILCSVLLIDKRGELTGNQLGLAAPVAVRDAIVSCTDVVPTIRWPNDLTVSGRKLAGILVESRARRSGTRAFVIGIGINCLQQHPHLDRTLAGRATSLEIESRISVDRSALAMAVLEQLDRWLNVPRSWDDAYLRNRWMAGADPFGCHAHLRQAGKVFGGTILDVDPKNGIVVQLDEGGIRVCEAADTTVVSLETGPGS